MCIRDSHYVFPAHSGDLLGAQRSAARELGIRLYMSWGSMDLSVKDGGLPPDSVVQTVDEIMADSVRCIEKYHDDMVHEFKPEIMLFGASHIGRDLAPRCAARLHTCLLYTSRCV